MNFTQIQYFMTLAEELSFSKAAEKLYVSQPNVSMQISSLESEWGMRLFYRKYRSVSLTPAGKIMYKTIKEATSLFNAGLEKALRNEEKESIPIVLGVPEHSDLGNLPDLLAEFQKKHPEIRLRVESCPIAELLLPTVNGRFDMVLNQLFMLENKKELNVREFTDSHFTIIISRDHPLVLGDPSFELSGFTGHELSVYIPTCSNSVRLVEHCKHICKSSGFTPDEVILTPNVNSALIAAKMCLGVAVLDEMVMNPNNSNLLFLPTPVVTEIVLAWRKDSEKECLEELTDMIHDGIRLS